MIPLRLSVPLLAMLLSILYCSPYRAMVVRGCCMTPTLRDGQVCLVDRTAYRSHSPQRGDVVVAPLGGTLCVKRVYAVGGDSFWMLRPSRPDGFVPIVLGASADPGWETLAQRSPERYRLCRETVPLGHVLLIGDNMPSSIDGRELGATPEGRVLGQVMVPPRTQAPLARTAPPAPLLCRHPDL
ncbi:MAG TPA: signal peptidase I [Armatimonadota bacterium]|jgi:signal peptidase I